MRLEVAMRTALSLANHGLGACYPNPSVGCVILDKFNNLNLIFSTYDRYVCFELKPIME